jgi:putative DNA primase/helicase
MDVCLPLCNRKGLSVTAGLILEIIDAAPAFVDAVEDPAAIAEAVRQFGLAELADAMKILRAAEGEARGLMLCAGAQRLGQLVAAGALHEGFAKASIEEAASNCLLIRDDGLKAVRSAIAAGIKLGKKQPRDLSAVRGSVPHVRREATALSRPRPAAVLEPSPSSPAEDPAPSSAPPSASSSFFAVFPAPPDVGESTRSTRSGASPEISAAGGEGGNRKPPHATETARERNMRLAFFPRTDLGNAERFCERFRDQLRWYQPKETWLAWDGKRWSYDGAAQSVARAEHETVRAIQGEAEAVRQSGRNDVPDPKPDAVDFVVEVKRDGTAVLYSDKLAAWGRTSEGLNKLGALSKLGSAYLAVGTEELDADKMKINVNNGTLVVARKSDGEDYISFQPHDPANLITKISPVDYDPRALCPEYDKFLARVQPSQEMRIFLHQWFGLSLTGDVSEQKLAYFYGNGSNGKSVLMDAVSYVAGDYSETVPIETFLDSGKARSAGQASPDLAILPGIRMLRTSEPEKNSKLAEAMVKLVTGGEPVLARHLNKGFFKFNPQFKLTISGNHKPKISGADDGIWRRFQLVLFKISIKKEERDPRLSEKLMAEASGILNRLLDGLRHWCDKGLIEPEDVTAATAEYRSVSDPLSRFLAACVEASSGDRVQSSSLYAVFEAWCKSSGETAWKQKGFSMAMDERGFKRKHSDVTWFLDVKLIRGVHDFVDYNGQPINSSQDDNQEAADAGNVEF